jgi:hypothetical protein
MMLLSRTRELKLDAKYDTVVYWKQRAMNLEKLLEASTQREQILMENLQESIKDLGGKCSFKICNPPP